MLASRTRAKSLLSASARAPPACVAGTLCCVSSGGGLACMAARPLGGNFSLPLSLLTVALTGCLDESGNPVDWFAAVKVPRSTSNGAGTGLTYYYLDANRFVHAVVRVTVYALNGQRRRSHSSWQLSSHSLSGTSGAIVSSVKRCDRRDCAFCVRVLTRPQRSIYHPASGTGALVWNDEYPECVRSLTDGARLLLTRCFWSRSGQEPSGVAHAKGMLLIDGSSGMYLIHRCALSHLGGAHG